MNKGQTNNPGGRPKGAKNKITSQTKELIIDIINDNIPQLKKDLKELKPNERISALLGLLKFVVPVAKDKEMDEETNNTLNTLINRLFPVFEKDE